MSTAHQALLALSCLLLSAGATTACILSLRSPGARAHAGAYEQRVGRHLSYLQLALSARQLLAAQLGAAALALAIALAARSSWPLAVGVAAAVGPRLWLTRAARARTARIEAQLDSWLLALANTLRANPALGAALAASAELFPPPLARELARVEHEQRLGVGLDRALRHMAERVESPALGAALAILRIASATGGDLSRTLEGAAASLREMARLDGVVRSKTAEGRAQTAVIAIAPLALVAMLDELDPNLLSPLWSTALGHAVVAVALALWAAALLLARKIVAIDI